MGQGKQFCNCKECREAWSGAAACGDCQQESRYEEALVEGRRQGAAEERAKIVALIREVYPLLADDIERGEHETK